MKPQTALIGTNGAVELHTVANVHMHFATVVDPWHPERDNALRLDNALHNLGFFKLWMLVVHVLYGNEHFSHSLKILQFARMLRLQRLHDFFHFHSISVLMSLIIGSHSVMLTGQI